MVTLFLCGDVMTGRGIDQVLPHAGNPQLHESYVESALSYVELAERISGPIPRAAGFDYIWGDALQELEREAPAARIANLETAITSSDEWWEGKGIHYRMHPDNARCLTEAKLDCCVLANNHVLDWGYPGLQETLDTLRGNGIATTGAGGDLDAAQVPAQIDTGLGGRVLVFGLGAVSSGIPVRWGASGDRPGVHLLADLSATTVEALAVLVGAHKRPGDVVVASIHWGENWEYRIAQEQVDFAHALIDEAGIDIVHGHSSHHVKAIEVHSGKLILYGCGDLLTDYEGITSYREFRGDLGLMYFPDVDPTTGKLVRMRMTPTQVRRFRIQRANAEDALWLAALLNRLGKGFGTSVEPGVDQRLELRWK
jgi:poly-gamma-glutamate capsule biosynthesis protein CapA/YwtB (metallophosphatase superfamily)